MARIGAAARATSRRINRMVEGVAVAFLVLLVLDVWLGLILRHAIPLPITFTEELARYLMIWMALLAVSSAIVHREHIGVGLVFARLPARVRRWLAVAFDALAFAFFAALFWHGLDFVERGFRRVTMIHGLPKGVPFLIVPIASALACVQLLLMAVHDIFAEEAPATTGAAVVTADAAGPVA